MSENTLDFLKFSFTLCRPLQVSVFVYIVDLLVVPQWLRCSYKNADSTWPFLKNSFLFLGIGKCETASTLAAFLFLGTGKCEMASTLAISHWFHFSLSHNVAQKLTNTQLDSLFAKSIIKFTSFSLPKETLICST